MTSTDNQVGIVDWVGCLIHESHDLASVEQHYLRIKALYKGNIIHELFKYLVSLDW